MGVLSFYRDSYTLFCHNYIIEFVKNAGSIYVIVVTPFSRKASLATIGVCVFGAVYFGSRTFLFIFPVFASMGTFCPLAFGIMYMEENKMQGHYKKTIIVHVLKILYNFTSFEYPASQTAIVNYLNDIDISCTRKTVGRNLKYLIDSGLPIKRKQCKNGGYYYDLDNDNFFVRTKINDEKEKKQ